jgi:hypothetical protein
MGVWDSQGRASRVPLDRVELLREGVERARRALQTLLPRRLTRKDVVVPTPIDFRRRVVPALVWSVAAAVCVVVLVDRAQVEYIALDSVSGGDASARASETPVRGPERPIASQSDGSLGILAPAALAESTGGATPAADPGGIWWCRTGDPMTVNTSPPLMPGDEVGGELRGPLTIAAECDPIAASTEPFVAEWTLPVSRDGELRP